MEFHGFAKRFKEDFLSAADSSPAGEGNLGREIVEKCGSQGGFVFNGVNGVLHIKYVEGEKEYIEGVGVWSNVCKA